MIAIDFKSKPRINRAASARTPFCVLLCSLVLMVLLTFYPCNVVAQSTANKDTHSKYYTDLFEYGIMGVGNRSIDQAAVLARAIASTPDGGEIVCRAGTVMYVSSITIVHRRALRFATAGYGYANGGPCQVIYIGATGGMLLNLDSDYDIVFDGWTFWGGNAAYTVSINKNTSCASGVTLIPRAIWPDKPSMSEANQFYQVAYGLTDPDQLNEVSIAVGTVAESFINFGWWGPFLIMIPLGIFLDYFQHAFLARDSGWVFNAIGIAMVPTFLSLESQMAQYLGGIIQCIGVILLVLWPILHLQVRKGRGQPVGELVTRGLRMPLPVPRRFL